MAKLSDKEIEMVKKAAKDTGTLCCSNCGRPSGFFRIQLVKRYLVLPTGKSIKMYLCHECDKSDKNE